MNRFKIGIYSSDIVDNAIIFHKENIKLSEWQRYALESLNPNGKLWLYGYVDGHHLVVERANDATNLCPLSEDDFDDLLDNSTDWNVREFITNRL